MKQNLTVFEMEYDGKKYPCSVPCTLYSVLLGNGVIDDPYAGENEKKYIGVARKDCKFTSRFEVGREAFGKDRIELVFKGLDTLVTVKLNGTELGFCNNMHRTWRFDVKDIVRAGENLLELYFFSPLNYTDGCELREKLHSPDISLNGYGHLRKCYSSYGWDWGPVIPDSGIYREVYLSASSGAEIADVAALTVLDGGAATVNVKTEVKHYGGEEIVCELISPDGAKYTACGGSCAIRIEKPMLWWAHGMGGQPLYTLNVYLRKNGVTVDSAAKRIGLRTLSVSTQKDAYGKEFCFVLNGKKVFAMGANYIPEDAIIPRTSRERTEKLLEACIEANFNTVRVWGGGYYPDDYFYDLCDELGLIVWQDFMFACSTVSLKTLDLGNILAEAEEFVVRIRSHPCIGLLCGNNEVEESLEALRAAGMAEGQLGDYIKIFECELPKLVKRIAPEIFYRSSSPSTRGGAVNTSDRTEGDIHLWEVWHGGQPLSYYRDVLCRFCSEYGFESFPSVKTLKTVARGEELAVLSPTMQSHQKRAGGNEKIIAKLKEYLVCPDGFEDFVYASQIMQAEAIRYGAEHFRRHRGICAGSVYWQLNDNWPAPSWSSVDYYGRKKALHYYARRFYAPVCVSAEDDGYNVRFNVDNNTLKDVSGTLRYRVVKNSGETEESVCIPLTAKALSSVYSQTVSFESLKGRGDEYAVLFDFSDGRGVLSEGDLFFVRYGQFKFLKPQIKVVLTGGGGAFRLEICAKQLVKALEIDFENFDAEPDDNYFTLCNGSKTVRIKSGKPREELLESLRMKSLNGLI